MPPAAPKPKAIRSIAIALLHGCGDPSLGFERDKIDIVVSVKIGPIHSYVNGHSFPYSATNCADVKNLSGTDMHGIWTLGYRSIDVVIR